MSVVKCLISYWCIRNIGFEVVVCFKYSYKCYVIIVVVVININMFRVNVIKGV